MRGEMPSPEATVESETTDSGPQFCARTSRTLLGFAAERAAVGAGVERLAAVPAEARLRAPRARGGGAGCRAVPRATTPSCRPPPTVAPACAARRVPRRGRQHVVQQLGGALIARVIVRRHRLHDDVVDGLRDLGVLQPRRRHELARISRSRSAGAGVSYGSIPVSIWYIVTPSE